MILHRTGYSYLDEQRHTNNQERQEDAQVEERTGVAYLAPVPFDVEGVLIASIDVDVCHQPALRQGLSTSRILMLQRSRHLVAEYGRADTASQPHYPYSNLKCTLPTSIALKLQMCNSVNLRQSHLIYVASLHSLIIININCNSIRITLFLIKQCYIINIQQKSNQIS